MRTADLLILVGVVAIALGVALRVVPGLFGWFGHLPGDIRIGDDTTRVFIPVTSMIVVSVVLTIVINVVGRFLRRG